MIRDFLKAMFSEWASGVTGSLSAPFFIAALVWPEVRYPAIALAVSALYVSTFLVWKKERQTSLDLLEKVSSLQEELHAAADITGTIYVRRSTFNPRQEQTLAGSMLDYDCDCVNSGKTRCEIVTVLIKIVPPDNHWFEIIEEIVPVLVEPERAFRRKASCYVQGVWPRDLQQSEITITLKDSMGRRHRNTLTHLSPQLLTPADMA
jgi:hypothetical protein